VVSIHPVIENDEVTFRNNDAMGLASFTTNGVSLTHYFTTSSKDKETSYVLNPKEGTSLPHGTLIRYNGTLQWATQGNPNSYKRNATFDYVYGSVCEKENNGEGEGDTTSVEDLHATTVSYKTIINGQFFIVHGNRTYDAQGRELR
jgi:hypothetical protein